MPMLAVTAADTAGGGAGRVARHKARHFFVVVSKNITIKGNRLIQHCMTSVPHRCEIFFIQIRDFIFF